MGEKKGNWHFRIGTLKLTILSDGIFPVSKEFFFAETPETIIQHIPNEYEAPLNFLLIDTGEQKILVDAGFGEEYLPKRGQLLNQLKTEGIAPEDIDIVIITHGHLDHIGGLLSYGEPVFSKANHFIREEEWSYWMARTETSEYKKLSPLKEQISLITSDIDISPGIRLQHTPGHTKGHLAVSILSEGDGLLVASDILNDPSTLQHLPSYIAAELEPEEGLSTRKSFLEHAYTQSSMVFACHYPFPGLGYVKKENEQWTWTPIECE